MDHLLSVWVKERLQKIFEAFLWSGDQIDDEKDLES
jgi:hypothetical protein